MMQVTYRTWDGRTRTLGSGDIEAQCFPPRDQYDPYVFFYTTEAGGVTKETVELVHGTPRIGFIGLEGLVVEADDGTYTHRGHWGLVPGGSWSKTFYDGDPVQYWRARGIMDRTPPWAPSKLAEPVVRPQIGPYSPWWFDRGDAKSGAGIDFPRFMDWRTDPHGYLRTYEEAAHAAERDPVAYLDERGEPRYWRMDDFTLTGGSIPDGYHFDLDDAADWWPGVKDLAKYTKHDGQHAMRGWRAAVALRGFDPHCKAIADRWLNHVKLAWAPNSDRDKWMSSGYNFKPYLWTSRQILKHLDEHPGPSGFCGREFSHALALADALEPHGELSADLQQIVMRAVDPRTGVCYLTNNKQELNGDWGAYHPDSPWDYPDKAAQVFQWNLLNDVVKRIPATAEASRWFEAYCAPKTRWYADNLGNWYGNVVPHMHLMRGDLDGRPIEEYLQYCALPGTPVEGTSINYMDRKLWEDAI